MCVLGPKIVFTLEIFLYLVIGLAYLCKQEEKNENHGSRRLRSDADKSNVEIIVLDSDSDSDVHMEGLVISNSMLVLYLILFL